ncbi:MAG: putative transposase [Porticoccaceae bacterium]|jgi:putative transposase
MRYRNIDLDLIDSQIVCGRDRVLRLMQSAGLRAQRGYRRPRGYYGGSPNAAATNLLNR